jgi:outer membrane protein assembly factor BamD
MAKGYIREKIDRSIRLITVLPLAIPKYQHLEQQVSRMKFKLAALMICTLVVLSCGPKAVEFDPAKQTDSEIYQQAAAALQDEDYIRAREAFRIVFDNFPQSDYRILAKLGYADSYYLEGTDASYILAISEYQDFISLFPFSPKAAYAQFQIGLCEFQMVEKPDRDQTNTRKALEALRKVIDNYPNSEYYKPAYDKLIECYSLLAEHEFYIARFYARTGKPKATVQRLQSLLKTYPESVYKPEYIYYLAKGLLDIAQTKEGCKYIDMLLTKWPDTEYTKKAQLAQTVICEGAPAPAPTAEEKPPNQ